jgi:hypothetical protein
MTETERHRPLRSIWAIAGLLFIFIVTSIVDVVLHATSVFPPWGQPMSDALFGLATAYRIVISVAGCYIAARLAPDRAMGHALVLGVIGVVISAIGAAVTGTRGRRLGRIGIRCCSSSWRCRARGSRERRHVRGQAFVLLQLHKCK